MCQSTLYNDIKQFVSDLKKPAGFSFIFFAVVRLAIYAIATHSFITSWLGAATLGLVIVVASSVFSYGYSGILIDEKRFGIFYQNDAKRQLIVQLMLLGSIVEVLIAYICTQVTTDDAGIILAGFAYPMVMFLFHLTMTDDSYDQSVWHYLVNKPVHWFKLSKHKHLLLDFTLSSVVVVSVMFIVGHGMFS